MTVRWKKSSFGARARSICLEFGSSWIAPVSSRLSACFAPPTRRISTFSPTCRKTFRRVRDAFPGRASFCIPALYRISSILQHCSSQSPLSPLSRLHRGRRESEFPDDSARVVHQPVQRGAKGHSRDSEGGVDAHPHDLERVVIFQQGRTADWPAAQSQQSDHCSGLFDSLPLRVTHALSWINDLT